MTQLQANESAKKGIVEFNISNSEIWKKWVKLKSDGGHSECCLRYSARWANLMDLQIASGKKLKDIANTTSHEANTEGITRFMYEESIIMLVQVWAHGEKLKQWYNGEKLRLEKSK